MRKSARARRSDAAEAIPSLRPISAAAAPDEKVEIFDCPQGSDDWFNLRLGMPTASRFGIILREGNAEEASKTRRQLLHKLAGERLTGEPMEDFQSKAMRRGKEMEPEARQHYAFTRQVELRQVGFVRRSLPGGRFVGASPDSLVIGTKRALEIKTMAPHLMIAMAEGGRFPLEHRAQCHGTLWVCGLDVIDLLIFYRGMPLTLKYEIERDDIYIRSIADAVEAFDYELRQLVERIKDMGGKGGR